jgi:hypothetical protein
VKDYVRIARSRSREVFVPLAHPPGHAQVDFGECIGAIGGVRMKLHVFRFDLPHSDARALPELLFEACDKRPAKVSSTALVRYRMNDYSAPTAYGFRDVLVKGFVDEVAIRSSICGGSWKPAWAIAANASSSRRCG